MRKMALTVLGFKVKKVENGWVGPHNQNVLNACIISSFKIHLKLQWRWRWMIVDWWLFDLSTHVPACFKAHGRHSGSCHTRVLWPWAEEGAFGLNNLIMRCCCCCLDVQMLQKKSSIKQHISIIFKPPAVAVWRLSDDSCSLLPLAHLRLHVHLRCSQSSGCGG